MQEKERESRPILILGGLSLLFFLLWFSKGFNMPIESDTMKDAVNAIDFRFPHMLFSNIDMTAEGIWHRSRWSADLLSYLSFHSLSKIIAFFTGDIVTALFIGQGFYIGLVFLSFSWLITLYGSALLGWKLFSKESTTLFLFSSFFSIFFYFPSILAPYYFTNYFRGPWILNYYWATILVFYALYPYWKFLFSPFEGEEKKGAYKTAWLFLIICAAFSSIAATIIYGFSLFTLCLWIIMEKGLPIFFKNFSKETFFAFSFILLSILGEKIGRGVGASIIFSSERILHFIRTISFYTFLFIAFNLIPFLWLFFKKRQLFGTISKGFAFMFLIMSAHIFILIFGYNNSFGTYFACSNIMLFTSAAISWAFFVHSFSSQYLYAILLFFIISHFVAFISYLPRNDYGIRQALYKAHGEAKANGIKFIEVDRSLFPSEGGLGDEKTFYFDVFKNFCHQVGVVDKSIEIRQTAEVETK